MRTFPGDPPTFRNAEPKARGITDAARRNTKGSTAKLKGCFAPQSLVIEHEVDVARRLAFGG